jgi:hypothetical protein
VHRRPLIDLLQRYGARHPGEAPLVARFLAFA